MEVTRGQFLDMTAQASATMTVDDYWPLVSGKTAALLSTSTHIGAVLGNAPTEKQEAFQLFAFHLGLAFQVQDDILGIWGNEALTGKSAASDLLAGKKTLPVVFGLQAAAEFAAAWERGPILESDIPRLAEKLASEGGRAFAEAAAAEQTALALKHLERAGASGEAAHELLSLAQQLLTRMN
jgi:geranylgeranyl diphosphate synthase type I